MKYVSALSDLLSRGGVGTGFARLLSGVRAGRFHRKAKRQALNPARASFRCAKPAISFCGPERRFPCGFEVSASPNVSPRPSQAFEITRGRNLPISRDALFSGTWTHFSFAVFRLAAPPPHFPPRPRVSALRQRRQHSRYFLKREVISPFSDSMECRTIRPRAKGSNGSLNQTLAPCRSANSVCRHRFVDDATGRRRGRRLGIVPSRAPEVASAVRRGAREWAPIQWRWSTSGRHTAPFRTQAIARDRLLEAVRERPNSHRLQNFVVRIGQ
jgi:hypothetical protein